MLRSGDCGGDGVKKVKRTKEVILKPYIFVYEGREIQVEMVKKSKSRCAITVNGDGVKCRFSCACEIAVKFIETKKKWIYYKVLAQENQKKEIEEKAWSCLLFGEETPIVLEVDENLKKFPARRFGEEITTHSYITKYGVVKYENKLIICSQKDLDIEQVHDAVRQWKLYFTKSYFAKQTEKIYKKVFDGEFEMPLIDTKFCSSYYGKNFKRKKIIYNVLLINQPSKFIGFVIAHELCHCLEMNHKKDKFYTLLESICPDYKSYRKARIIDGRDY